jgi:uncharacterized membrane protein
MSEPSVTALLAVYPNISYARNAVAYLTRLERSDLAHIEGLAVAAKDPYGKVTVEESGLPTGKRGAKRGVLLGAAVGLIFPPSVLAATIAGAGLGGVIGHVRGKSKAHALQALGEQIEPGHAGVIVIAHDEVVDQIEQRLVGCESIHRQQIDPETLAAINQEDKESG